MNTIFRFTSFVIFFSGSLYAQPSSSDKDNTIPTVQLELLTKKINSQLPNTLACEVTWSLQFGYFQAEYKLSAIDQITWYDNKFQYLETFKRSVWDDHVPPILKMGFENSGYGLLEVISYWENISQENDDYYFELLDTDEKIKKVWADSNGAFFEKPLFIK
jgi:hypothetical protein